jgi:signal transduction histidine kinase
MATSLVLTVSIALQLAAALLALRLVFVTGYRVAWAMIAGAISLMAVRRGITLYGFVVVHGAYVPDPTAEVVALAISVLMLGGVAGIARMFRAVKRSEAELARHREHLEDLVAERSSQLAESHAELARSQRLASIGALAAGIAHEINNPLGMILLETGLATEDIEDNPAVARRLSKITEYTERCGRIVKNVLQFSRDEPTMRHALDVNATVRRARDLMREYCVAHGVGLELDLDGTPLTALGNATEIEQVWVNLIHNAIGATPSGGRVVMTTRKVGDKIVATVVDNGRGMSESEREHALDPFFTNRAGAGGTGLGLSICHGIVTSHGGTIDVASVEGRGTTLTVELPMATTNDRL